ncbi:MAG: hypothetical protein Q8N63_01215 [Nanoarchaeota archaeon]|nr:hypothetical protein [Nanoarchaeota archaeon]
MVKKKRIETFYNPNIKKSRSKLWILILLLIIALVGAVYLYLPKDCGTDRDCFIQKAQTCSKAKIIDYKEGNEFIYEIKDKTENDCIFYIKMNKMKENTDYNLVKALEGKDMLCKVSLDNFKTNPLADIKDIIDSCSGSLKEALQQLTIERLYGVIIGNLGGVNKELQKLVS